MMDARGRCRLVVTCLALVCGGQAWAHKPLFCHGTAPDAEHALVVRDVTLSQVVYHTLTPQAPRVWMAFEARKGQKLHFQVGVPQIERFRDLRPVLVVLGPGLPAAGALPFGVPAGLGGVAFATADVGEPRRFHEPFTGTRSWILRRVEVTAQADGRHYAVVHAPGVERAKAWVAIGTREAFGLGDWLKMPVWIARVRRFHEVGGVPLWVPLLGGVVVVVCVCAL